VTEASHSRTRWLLALLALVAALFLVVASACGGDDDEDVGDNGATATQSSNDGGDDGGDDNGENDLSELTADYERFEGHVKYTASGFPEDDLLRSMEIYQAGSNSRVDIDSDEGLVTIIDTPDASYVCSKDQCLQYPAGNTGGVGSLFTSFIDPATIEDQFGDAAYDVTTEEIAGLDATCFKASGNEVCFGDGGLLLRVTFAEANGSGTLEAVEAGTDIPDDAFDPPFDVIDLGDFGQ